MCERVQRHGLFMTLNGAKRFSACSSMELTLKQPGTTVSDSKSVGGLSFLVEGKMYQSRLQIQSEIWTYGEGLRAHASNSASSS